MTKALTLDQYEKWVKEFLDSVRNIEEERDEEFVIMVGGISGNAQTYAASESNPSLRLNGNISFHEDAFEETPGAELLMPVMSGDSWRRQLLGSVAFPREVLSEEIEERIDEQQQQLEEHYPEMASGGSEAAEGDD